MLFAETSLYAVPSKAMPLGQMIACKHENGSIARKLSHDDREKSVSIAGQTQLYAPYSPAEGFLARSGDALTVYLNAC